MTGKGTGFFRPALPEERRGDYAAALIILLYCTVWVSLRLVVSTTMELDDAEQFIAAKVLSLGYVTQGQPPLLTWIYSAVSFLFGMNIYTIIGVKYALLFCFYFVFYLVARNFWEPKKALVVTASLLLFPTYGYEFNRNLSHTVFLAAMSSVTLLAFVRLLDKKTTVRYLLFGAVIGLGILSKYNFVFLLFALVLASLSSSEGKEVLFDGRVLLSAAVGMLIVLPHFFWLVRHDFPSVHEAFKQAHAGQVAQGSPLRLLSVVLSSFVEAFAFPLVFMAFFRRGTAGRGGADGRGARLFRLVPLYGLLLPPALVFVFRMGHFSGKWLTPVFFTIPLALFCSFDTPQKSLRNFGRLCVFAAVLMLCVRAFAGFYPDITGKLERIHVPMKALSEQLKKELAARGIYDMKQLVLVTEGDYLAANLEANIPEAEFLSANDLADKPVLRRNIVAVWDAQEEGPLLPKALRDGLPGTLSVAKIEEPYLHSKKSSPFVLGVAFVTAN